MKRHRSEYVFIRRWGNIMASFEYYIRQEQERAAEENAPLNAIYRGACGRWVTTDELLGSDIRARLGLPELQD